MSLNAIMTSRILVGYNKRRFHIYPDEITEYLINCNEIGFPALTEIATCIEEIAAGCNNNEQVKLLLETALMLKGAIYEEL